MTRQITRHSAPTRYALAIAALAVLAVPMPAAAAPIEPVNTEPTDDSTDEGTDGTDTDEPTEPAESVVQADPPNGVAWYLDAGGTELTGTSPVASIQFNVPPGWEPEADGSIEIPYSFEASASGVLAVAINGGYVTDVVLDETNGTTRMTIPSNRIRSGSNTVKVTGAIDLTIDQDCKDPAHPARRMQLGAETRMIVPLRPDSSASLTDFPEVLEPLGSEDRVVDVHLVGTAIGANLTAVAPIISALRGVVGQPIEVALTVHDQAAGLDSAQLSSERPTIVVGELDSVRNAPAITNTLELPTDIATDEDVGIVALGAADDGAPLLVITGTTDESIASAALTIAHASSRADLVGSVDFVTAFAPRASVIPGVDFSLADRGYPHRTLSGPGRDRTLYAFDVPLVTTPESATIRLSAGRSANTQDVLGVAVVVNGNRSGVIPFDENGQIDGSALRVQRGVLRPGRNFIRFEADFTDGVNDCNDTAPQQSVEISSSTLIELSDAAPRAAVDLDDLPYTFRSDADARQLRIVLPLRPTTNDQSTALDLAVLLGSPDFPATVVDANELDPAALRDYHLVILGEPARQPLHEWLGLDVAEEIASIDPADLPDVDLDSVVTVHQNPASAQHVALILTGLTAADAQQAADAVLDVKLRGSLAGHTTGVGHDGEEAVFGTTRRPLELLISDPDEDSTIDVDSASAIVESTLDPAAEAPASSTELPDNSGSTNKLVMGAIAGFALLLLLLAATVVFMRRRSADDADADAVADATDHATPDEGDGRDD